MIFDISPAVCDELKVWPGDTPPSREVLCTLADGANVTLSTLHATVHLGAHADAPSHYGLRAPTIDERPLETYVGPCQVVSVQTPRKARIPPDVIDVEIKADRVLFSTGTFPDPTRFNEDFSGLSPALVEILAAKGVRLLGIDTPSIDLFDSEDLPAHMACLRHDIAILEGLLLEAVPDGVYELIALPLKLVGFDGSPVRAVLRTVE